MNNTIITGIFTIVAGVIGSLTGAILTSNSIKKQKKIENYETAKQSLTLIFIEIEKNKDLHTTHCKLLKNNDINLLKKGFDSSKLSTVEWNENKRNILYIKKKDKNILLYSKLKEYFMEIESLKEDSDTLNLIILEHIHQNLLDYLNKFYSDYILI